MSRRRLAGLIGVAAVVSWGGRIGLLQDSQLVDWIRIVGSLVMSGAAVLALLVPTAADRRRTVIVGFALWTAAVWLTSLVSVWTTAQTIGFRLVHTGLAAGWLAIVWVALTVGRQASSSDVISRTATSTSSIDR